MKLTCSLCNASFSTQHNLNRHFSVKHSGSSSSFTCEFCHSTFTRNDDLKKHQTNVCKAPQTCTHCNVVFPNRVTLKKHEKECVKRTIITCINCKQKHFSDETHKCDSCDSSVVRAYSLKRHREGCNPINRLNAPPLEKGKVVVCGDSAKDVYFKNVEAIVKPEGFILSVSDEVRSIIQDFIENHGSLKSNVLLECTFKRIEPGTDDKIENWDANFKTKDDVLLLKSDLEKYISESIKEIVNEIDEFEVKGSGWSLQSIDGLLIRLTKFAPLRGNGYVPLPEKKTSAVINVSNRDNQSFKFAILCSLLSDVTDSHLSREITPERLNSLQHNFDFSCISFPTSISSISKFEKSNNVAINLYAFNNSREVYPLIISKNANVQGVDKHIDLLYLQDEQNDHYALIKDLWKLVSPQMPGGNRAHLMCKRCFKTFAKNYLDAEGKTAQQRLDEHVRFCNKFEPVRHIFPPEKEDKLQFVNYKFRTRIPVCIYADIKCMLQPTAVSSEGNASSSWSRNTEEHVPTCIGLHVKSYYPHLYKDKTLFFSGKNCIAEFMAEVKGICKEVENLYAKNEPLRMSEAEITRHEGITACELCKAPFDEKIVKCIDHDHLSGSYRFTTCSQCNLNKLRKPGFIPILFHNLSNYDSHFLVSALDIDDGKIEVIPQTSEKFISFEKAFNGVKIKARFLDSFRFLPASLDKLVKTMKEFPEMEQEFTDPEIRSLLLRKGVYPYSYVKSWEVLDDTSLPPKEEFYNDLTEEKIDDSDYEHARKVWNACNINTLFEYILLYLKTDVILLCDIFEQYRRLSGKHCGIDPAWCYSGPGFSWQAMLSMTGVKLDYIKDIDMVQFIESGIRRGITQCVKRHCKANNKYIPETFDPTQDSSYLLYAHVNNLYGWAMKQRLPYGGFKWASRKEIENFDITSMPDDGDTGYILDVDVRYPASLHDEHSQFPYLPERKKPPGSKTEKLLLTLEDKERYVAHYVNLKQAVQAGLIVTKIHRILKFKQRAWLAPFIGVITKLRTQATTDFEKNFYELVVTLVFEKTMESVQNRMKIKFVTNEEQLTKLAKNSTFKDRIFLKEGLISVSMAHTSITFNKPIYVGLTVLELSKALMYDLHYKNMAKFYPAGSLQLAYMDTDSFIYEIKTDDLYDDLNEMADLFDLSDYPPDHRCFNATNKKVVGKLKDETRGYPMREFVCLRPKLYAYEWNNSTCKKAKGVKRSAISHQLTMPDYLNTLNTKNDFYTTSSSITSKHHNVFTTKSSKKSLSFYDDKRIIQSNNIDTLPYGYKGDSLSTPEKI